MTPERYARVQELFLQACDLDEPDRQAFLVQQCAGDVKLCEEVEALLAHDDPHTLIRSQDDAIASFRSGAVVQSLPRSVGRGLQTIGLITKRLGPRGHLALGVFIASVLLTLVGFLLERSVRGFQKTIRAEALKEIVDAKISGLEMWFDHEEEKIGSSARSREFHRLASELVQLADEADAEWNDVRQSPLQDAIRQELNRLAGEEVDYALWDRRSITIADSLSAGQSVGTGVTPFGAVALTLVFEGKPRLITYDQEHSIRRLDPSETIDPHIGVLAPIHDEQGHAIAALLVHDIDSREQASRILRMVELGESGETYVFNPNGVMLSESRFTDQLREIGLLPADESVGTVRHVPLRDPGGDMTAGFRPEEPLMACPLTKMARHATAGNDGFDVDGYRDYRGVLVVGAWRWLDEYDIGVATELDVNESEPGHWMVILATWIVFGLFATSLGIIVFSYYSIHKLRYEIGEHRRLGQYTLERQIGEGGMGKVFKARHEFLKRPTAIKLLKPELVDKQSIARFEQEASLVSQLTHPNTIDVYDYGVTPEGIFFFVMEYIGGLSMLELVDSYGPLPPERAVYLLQQICESLLEAHNAGMIHRDLKPQNIMVCRRGGKWDVVKVLDFGLAKQTQATESQALTASAMLAGTPLYIAPERLRDPRSANPRTDIYSLGAVAFFLLTGRDVFQGNSVEDILLQVIKAQPPRPSELQDGIPLKLEELVIACLAKEPDGRPGSVTEILHALEELDGLTPWNSALALSWWNDHRPTNPDDHAK